MYYYSLDPKDIHQNGKKYRFTVQDVSYLFIPCYRSLREIREIYELSIELAKKGIYFHQIIMNNSNGFVTNMNGIDYILLKVVIESNDHICLQDILYFSRISIDFSKYKSLYRNEWNTMWSQKIDYFEYQVSQFANKYPIVRESFSYFCGLAENAIAYTNFLEKADLSLGHRRIQKNMSITELYNPLNLVIDYKVRDVTEYFKDKFIYGYLSFEEIKYYLLYNLPKSEYSYFFTRMLFPSFYFDTYEKVIENKISEKVLLHIIQRTNDYEFLLDSIYEFISKYVYILRLEWIKKI